MTSHSVHKQLVPGRGIIIEGIGLISFDVPEHELEDRLGMSDDGMWSSMGVFMYERFELTVRFMHGPALINWHPAQTTTTLLGVDPYALTEPDLIAWLTKEEGAPPKPLTSWDGKRAGYRFQRLAVEIKTSNRRTVALFPSAVRTN